MKLKIMLCHSSDGAEWDITNSFDKTIFDEKNIDPKDDYTVKFIFTFENDIMVTIHLHNPNPFSDGWIDIYNEKKVTYLYQTDSFYYTISSSAEWGCRPNVVFEVENKVSKVSNEIFIKFSISLDELKPYIKQFIEIIQLKIAIKN